ncbi:MAG: 1-acyl-sn-glycerol-3-phosphate acyltransferase, partial [Bacteroidales bacterium]|nr:1-acyl-sn-glycerol-3-phosphate acyltransferase [Bacteroidales bacterium]
MLSKQQASLAYRLLHQYSKCLIFHWYSEFEIVGQENIPYGKPCIIQPNHQNALMDCVTLLGFFHQPILFFARSDMFAKPWQAKILHFLKILPAYRQQEGWENIKKNEDNFLCAQQWLKQGNPLCIMPEGGQDEKHRLRPFVKGPFRIALKTQQDLDSQEHVYMLPIGIEHGDYNHAGFPLFINIGKPIDVQNYLQDYQQNNAVAINHIKANMHNAVQFLMFNVGSSEHYEEFLIIAYLCEQQVVSKNKWTNTASNRLKARQYIADRLQNMEANAMDISLLLEQTKCLKNDNINGLIMAKAIQNKPSKWANLCFVCLTSVLYLLGGVLNLPIWLIMYGIERKLGKSGFAATCKYVVWIVVAPVYQLLTASIVGICTQN